MKTLTAPLPWFGSKRLIAPQIVAHFDDHEIYYDLFAGSLAVLFAKKPCRQEVASELNPDVVNLLRCISDPTDAEFLHREVQHRVASETMFQDSARRLSEPWEYDFQNLGRAIEFLTVSWQGPSGLAGTTAKPRFAKRNTASGGSTAARWRSVAESIPAWHERLRNVEFRNADALELIGDVPDREGVVVYSDSPYFQSSRRGGNYAYDMTDEQLYDLAAKLRRFKKTRIVASYYECPEADECYAGWRKVRLDAPRKMGNVAGGESPPEVAGECLYVNH